MENKQFSVIAKGIFSDFRTELLDHIWKSYPSDTMIFLQKCNHLLHEIHTYLFFTMSKFPENPNGSLGKKNVKNCENLYDFLLKTGIVLFQLTRKLTDYILSLLLITVSFSV